MLCSQVSRFPHLYGIYIPATCSQQTRNFQILTTTRPALVYKTENTMKIYDILSGALYVFVVFIANQLSDATATDNDLTKQNLADRKELSSGNSLQRNLKALDKNRNLLNNLLSRQERSVFITDHGFGSRLQAGSNAARLTLRRGVYGIQGPGKRSSGLNSGLPFSFYIPSQSVNIQPQESAGINTDGLLSATNVQTSGSGDYEGINGLYNPVKRADNTAFYRLFRSKAGHGGDSGYGSRIQAGEQVAANMAAYESVYGGWGVGKR